MAELTDAINAAALAMYCTPRLAERNRDMAERAVNAAEAIIRADERAKVAEEIARAIEAQWDNYEPEWTEALRHLATIARQHA